MQPNAALVSSTGAVAKSIERRFNCHLVPDVQDVLAPTGQRIKVYHSQDVQTYTHSGSSLAVSQVFKTYI